VTTPERRRPFLKSQFDTQSSKSYIPLNGLKGQNKPAQSTRPGFPMHRPGFPMHRPDSDPYHNMLRFCGICQKLSSENCDSPARLAAPCHLHFLKRLSALDEELGTPGLAIKPARLRRPGQSPSFLQIIRTASTARMDFPRRRASSASASPRAASSPGTSCAGTQYSGNSS
jgi:hypothetical protein